MYTRKYLAVLLSFLMLLSAALASCSDSVSNNSNQPSQQTTDSSSDNPAESVESETEPDPLETLPEHNFEGYGFVILGDVNSNWWTISLNSEESNGEIINDTVYGRNSFVEDRYNTDVTSIETTEVSKLVKNSVLSGTHDYDMVWERMNSLMSIAGNGYLMDLYGFKQFDFDGSWWDKDSIEAFTLGGKLFYACNDINVHTIEGCSAMYYSKTMISNNSLENPYDLVRENKWTLDKMYEMMTAVAADTDGDGERGKGDTYGLVTGVGQLLSLIDGAGEQLVIKENDGSSVSFKLNIASEGVISVTEKVARMLNDETLTVIVNTDNWGYESFRNDMSLFYIMQLGSVVDLRYQMQNDFGILPFPMLNENQGYYTTSMEATAQAMCIPITIANPEAVGVIIETMAIYSDAHLIDAYYETTLKGKIARDNDTEEMLDILTGSRTFDFATLTPWGVYDKFRTNVAKNGAEGLSALAEQIQSKFDESAKNTIDSFSTVIS